MSTAESVEVSRPCPKCGAEIRHDQRFTPWCAQCEWNVDAGTQEDEASTLLERRRRMLARRHGERLLKEITNGASLRPHRDASSVLALMLAVAVNGSTVVMIALAVWLLVSGLGVTLFVVGLFLLAVAFLMRPRVARLPEGVPLLARSEAPELFAVIDEVAAVVGPRSVDRIAVDGQMNASVSTYGVLGRRLLTIGLPLWEILDPDERNALLGHELGHYANGDLRYGTMVWTALRSLVMWSYLLSPSPYNGNWLIYAANAITFLPWLAVEGVLILLDTLTLRSKQRGEYLADRFSAQVAGPDAAVRLMDKTFLDSIVATTLSRERNRQQVSREARDELRSRPEQVWERLTDEVAAVPEHERVRLRLADERQGHAVDSTHPPTHLRRDCLALGPSALPRVVVNGPRAARIAAELSNARRIVARRHLGA
jgi:Zn-dependent protease with chaperone function/endogenous inhibitor of DNA gyrase (YacG/DUF329 family)